MATRALISTNGQLSKLADEELSRFRIVVEGSDADHVKYPDAVTDKPVGITVDGCDAAEDGVSFGCLGRGETKVVKINGAGSKGDPICAEDPSTAAVGQARVVPSTAGAYWMIGRLLEDATDEQEVAIDDCQPVLVGSYDGTTDVFSVPAFAGDPTTQVESALWYDLTADALRVKNGTTTATIQVVED